MLTFPQCQAFKCPPDKKFTRLHDEGRLYLEATPAGGKYWRMKYEFGGKAKTFSIGVFPAVTLAEARLRRDGAKQLLVQGIDPTAEKKIRKLLKSQAYESFADCAKNYIANHPEWSESHLERINAQLNNDVLPYIGKRPIKDIKGTEIYACIDRIVKRDAIESAHRTLAVVSSIYDTVALDDIADATKGIKSRLPKVIRGHFLAITDPKRFADLLRCIDGYSGSPEVKSAFQIAPILFQRCKNVRFMRWSEIDLKAKLWTIPSANMKREEQEKIDGDDHLVPLPLQVIEILERLKPMTGSGEFVFPSTKHKDKPFSENAIRAALITIGFVKEQTFHGFRASGRTIATQVLGVDDRHLEAQLSHKIKSDPLKGAYNRTKWVEQRREMIQLWANYLDGLKAGADVIPFKAKAS